MPAANTDKFKKVARKWVGQIGAAGVSDGSTATIPLASTTSLPTDTAVDIVIDRVDSSGVKTPNSEETITGVVSGSNLATSSRGVEGSAQAHAAGAVAEQLWTANTWNDAVDGILVEHNQDGTHSTSVVTTLTATQTLTNKRITKRVVTVTQSATPTINTDNTDVAHITGLAQAITSMTTNLSGTPVNGDTLRINITDNGTGRAITWGASFESSGNLTLPSTTVASTRLDIGFVWNTATSKWRCVGIA